MIFFICCILVIFICTVGSVTEKEVPEGVVIFLFFAFIIGLWAFALYAMNNTKRGK